MYTYLIRNMIAQQQLASGDILIHKSAQQKRKLIG